MGGVTSVKKARFYISVGATYALTLIFGISALGLFDAAQPTPVANATPIGPAVAKTVPVKQGKPVKIHFPRLDLERPVDDGVYDPATGQWTLSGNHPHFALTSIMPNDYSGTTFIYGHNYSWVFGRLKELTPGDEVKVHTDNGNVFTYIYESSSDHPAKEVSYFKYDGPPRLTLQTCDGNWNEIRRMYQFRLEKVEP